MADTGENAPQGIEALRAVDEATPGQPVTMVIPQAATVTNLRADVVACWYIPNGDLSLSLMAFEGRTASITGQAVDENGTKGIKPSTMAGGPVLVEIGSLRLTPVASLQAVSSLLQAMIKFNVFSVADINASLKSTSIKLAE